MNACKLAYRVKGFFVVLLCTGCGWFGDNKSVQDIYIDDNNANSVALQLNYHHPSGRNVTQFEWQKVEITDHFNVQKASNSSGSGEERLRNTRDQDAPQNQFVGVGNVKANYELQQVSVRHIFKLDANGHFQIDLAPEVALMQLDSNYSAGNRHMLLDMQRFGAGITFTARWQFVDYVSLNFTGNHSIFEGNTASNTHALFLRLQPKKRFYIDLGKYSSAYDFGGDTRISYEQRVRQRDLPYNADCAYIYDGTQNSDLEFEASGYRLGVGFNF